MVLGSIDICSSRVLPMPLPMVADLLEQRGNLFGCCTGEPRDGVNQLPWEFGMTWESGMSNTLENHHQCGVGCATATATI